MGSALYNFNTWSDDILLDEMMILFRIGRNEGGLSDNIRENFKAICAEGKKRGLLVRKRGEE